MHLSWDAREWGVFDPSTDTFSEEGTAFLPASSFTGAVVTRDDEVVLVPGENYHKVGIFDPSGKASTTRLASIPNTHGERSTELSRVV